MPECCLKSEEAKIHVDESVEMELGWGKHFCFWMGEYLDVFIGGEEGALEEGEIIKIQTKEQGLWGRQEELGLRPTQVRRLPGEED